MQNRNASCIAMHLALIAILNFNRTWDAFSVLNLGCWRKKILCQLRKFGCTFIFAVKLEKSKSESLCSRRASPPRPSLMIGDMDACRAAFNRLQGTCTALLDQHAGQSRRGQVFCCCEQLLTPLRKAHVPLLIFPNPPERLTCRAHTVGRHCPSLQIAARVSLVPPGAC